MKSCLVLVSRVTLQNTVPVEEGSVLGMYSVPLLRLNSYFILSIRPQHNQIPLTFWT